MVQQGSLPETTMSTLPGFEAKKTDVKHLIPDWLLQSSIVAYLLSVNFKI